MACLQKESTQSEKKAKKGSICGHSHPTKTVRSTSGQKNRVRSPKHVWILQSTAQRLSTAFLSIFLLVVQTDKYKSHVGRKIQ